MFNQKPNHLWSENVKNERNFKPLKLEYEPVKASHAIQQKSQNLKTSESPFVRGDVKSDRHDRRGTLIRHKPVVNQKSQQFTTITLTLLHPNQILPIQNWRFEKALNIWIGRSANNHVVLRSCVVSRHHLELRQLDGKWILTSFGTNGTYVNNEKISKIYLEDGTIFHLGRTGPAIQINLTGSEFN